MIYSREEACGILGVPADADDNLIKKSYKSLVKLFHPDSCSRPDATIYRDIVEAYEYLEAHPRAEEKNTSAHSTTSSTSGKIVGNPGKIYRRGANYAEFEKKYELQKKEKARERIRQLEEYEAEQKRKQEEYDRTMEAIRNIRLAEAIKKLIRDSEQ